MMRLKEDKFYKSIQIDEEFYKKQISPETSILEEVGFHYRKSLKELDEWTQTEILRAYFKIKDYEKKRNQFNRSRMWW